MSTVSLIKYASTAIISCLVTTEVIAANTPPFNPEHLTGRWILVDKSKTQTVDITRCGEKWCGIDIDKTGKCGRVSLKLEQASIKRPDQDVSFTGQYSMSEESEPYAVGASAWEGKGKEKSLLYIYGHTGGRFLPFTRTYPLNLYFSREGDPVCRIGPSAS